MGHYDYVIFDEKKLKEYDPIGFVNLDIKPFFIFYDGKDYKLNFLMRGATDLTFKKYDCIGDNLDMELVMKLFIHQNMQELEDKFSFIDSEDIQISCDNFENIKELSLKFIDVYNDDYKYELLIQDALPYFEKFRLNPDEFSFDKKINI